MSDLKVFNVWISESRTTLRDLYCEITLISTMTTNVMKKGVYSLRGHIKKAYQLRIIGEESRSIKPLPRTVKSKKAFKHGQYRKKSFCFQLQGHYIE